MITIVLKNDIIHFTKGTLSKDRAFIQKFREVPEDTNVDLKEKGKFPKRDIMLAFFSVDRESAEERLRGINKLAAKLIPSMKNNWKWTGLK